MAKGTVFIPISGPDVKMGLTNQRDINMAMDALRKGRTFASKKELRSFLQGVEFVPPPTPLPMAYAS